MMPTKYRVTLDIYRGANLRPEHKLETTVDADTPLGALRKAEDFTNVTLPDDKYAAARGVVPVIDLVPAAGEAPEPHRNWWTDAYLAAFAISGNHELVTFDRGFGRYEADGLRWHLLEVSG